MGVSEVLEAQTCGLKSGDVIIKFNGHAVSNTRELVDAAIASGATDWNDFPADAEYEITVIRNGEPLVFTFTPFENRREEKSKNKPNQYPIFGQVEQFERASQRLIHQLAISDGIAMVCDIDQQASYWDSNGAVRSEKSISGRKIGAISGAAASSRFVLADDESGEIVIWNPASKAIEGILEDMLNFSG